MSDSLSEESREVPSKTSNKHQLRIIFDGVIAVGPPHPDPTTGGGERDGPFYGVMVHSTRRKSDRSRRLDEDPAKYIPAHVPTIYTLLEPDGGRPADHKFQLSSEHPVWHLWHPTRERMEFSFDKNNTPGKLIYDEPGLEPGGGAAVIAGGAVTVRSIDDVPDAREIWLERAELLDGLLSVETPVRPEADAQILVPWGSVRGAGLFEKGEGVMVLFDPQRAPADPKIIVPNVIVFVDVEDVEIAMYSLDSGEVLDPLRFHLTADAELWISNGDPTDTTIDLERLSDEVSRLQRGRNADDHIEGIVERFNRDVSADIAPDRLRTFFTSSGDLVIPRPVRSMATERLSNVDLDFELFYSVQKNEETVVSKPLRSEQSDFDGLPIPMRADGKNFTGPDCYVNLVACPDELLFKSKLTR